MNFLQKHLQKILVVVAALFLGTLVYSQRSKFADTWEIIKDVNLAILVLIPLMQIASYFCVGNFYHLFLKNLGAKNTSRRRLTELVFALTFTNQILPSGGASGIGYFIYALRGKASASMIALTQLTRYIISYYAYGLVLLFAYAALLLGGNLGPNVTRILVTMAGSAATFTITISVLIKFRTQINSLLVYIKNGLFVAIGIKPNAKKKKNPRFKALKKTFDEFYQGYVYVTKNYSTVRRPAIFMAMSTFFELMIVYLSFMAIGVDVNIGIVLLAFAAANAAGVVSIVPGDVGVHEATMIAVLSYAGVSPQAAIAGTLIYRVFNKSLFLPVGFYFYSKLLKPARHATKSA